VKDRQYNGQEDTKVVIALISSNVGPLSVLLRFTASDYPFGIFKRLTIALYITESRKSKKDRQYNGKKKKDRRTNKTLHKN
jgi:hypothetical protein